MKKPLIRKKFGLQLSHNQTDDNLSSIKLEIEKILFYTYANFDDDYCNQKLSDCEFHCFNLEKIEKNTYRFTILLGRPGIFIGKGGQNIDRFNKELEKLLPFKVVVNPKMYDPFINVRRATGW